MAKAHGVELKQTYAKESQLLGYKAGRYAHARQFKLMRKVIKRQRTIVGRLQRDADQGYRSVDKDNPQIEIKHRGKHKRSTDEERRLLKRRQAIEPIIGHLKADHLMDRCHLKGSEGDALHAVLCAAGYNIRCLLRMIVKKGLGLLLCLFQASGLARMLEKLGEIVGHNRPQNSDQRWVLA